MGPSHVKEAYVYYGCSDCRISGLIKRFSFLALVVAKKNLECELNTAALLTAAWRHKRGAADGEAAVIASAKSQQENHLLPHLQKQA